MPDALKMLTGVIFLALIFSGARAAGEKYSVFKGVRFYSEGPAVDFMRDGSEFHRCKTLEQVKARTGEAEKEKVRLDESGRKMTLLSYPGLSLEFQEDLGDPDCTCRLLKAVIQDPRWKVAAGLEIGVERCQVGNVLGQASETKEDADYYWSDNEDGEYVVFSYEQDRISRIEWRCYAD